MKIISSTRFRKMSWKIFWAFLSFPTSMAGRIGNTAASSVSSDTAGGVIGRYCDQPQNFPGVAHFHTMRINQPGGKFYTTEYLKKLCDLWEFRGSGITNMHGSTGDIIFLGTTTPQLEEIFFELTHNYDQDLGGSGSNLRTPSDCVGQARCEWACYDTQAICYDLTQEYQDELHRPAFPYKFKFKFDGCPQLLRGLHRSCGYLLHRYLERRHQNRPGSGCRVHGRRVPVQRRIPLRTRLGTL